MIAGLAEMIAQLPREAVGFPGTQFPFPVSEALYGAPPDLTAMRAAAAELERAEAAPQEAAWVALLAAEAVESAQADRGERFIGDGQFRGYVFSGIKWRAGWALVLGEHQQPYARAFDAASFIVFTTRADVGVGKFLGARPTASIYLAQMLARYALLYSDVQPGARHELTHFVEDHGPAVLIVSGPMGDVEALLCLALMRLGVRAVVTAGFPWEVGDRVEVTSPEEAVEAAAAFENLRIRSPQNPDEALPACANQAYANQRFEPAETLGGEDSFLLLRRGAATEGVSIEGEPAGELGLLITVDDETLDGPAEEELEGAARGALNLLDGLRMESASPLVVVRREAGKPGAVQMAEVVRRALRLEFPRLGPLHVTVYADPRPVAAEAAEHRRRREEEIAAWRERAVVYTCEACAPFSREHICVTHPLRAPMCGRRWTEMLVGARYMTVSAGRPWRRRGRPENCCAEVPLGRALDAVAGEYEGLNEFVRQATGGRMLRVCLHSVRAHPHSSCGCFAALAWWSEELGGLGLMHRGYEGAAPDGLTWNELANRAGGKQQPGITGVSFAYLRSPKFLQGDGGWGAVKWMTEKVRESRTGSGV